MGGIVAGRETLIEIDKAGKGLGLSIVGGSDTVLGTVVVHEVYQDGAAALDERLKPGDQILEVNGQNLRGVAHEQAIAMLRRTPAKVRLLIYRDVNLQLSLLDPTQIYNCFEIELQKKPGRGLGLSIVGRKHEPGVYVSEVVRSGVADLDGRLLQGDQILAVNDQDVTSAMQEDVAAMLKTCTGRVILKVGRWKLSDTAAVTTLPLLTDPPPPAPPCRIQSNNNSTLPQVMVDADDQLKSDLSPVTEEPSSGCDQRSLPADDDVSVASASTTRIELLGDLREDGCDAILVELHKQTDQQLGMGIGKRSRGILITSLQPGSSAARELRIGDRLMAVNGIPVSDQISAVNLVKGAVGQRLLLQVSRPNTS